jgi:hypothetical protein
MALFIGGKMYIVEMGNFYSGEVHTLTHGKTLKEIDVQLKRLGFNKKDKLNLRYAAYYENKVSLDWARVHRAEELADMSKESF